MGSPLGGELAAACSASSFTANEKMKSPDQGRIRAVTWAKKLVVIVVARAVSDSVYRRPIRIDKVL